MSVQDKAEQIKRIVSMVCECVPLLISIIKETIVLFTTV